MSLDLGPAIRTAMIEAEAISGELGQWESEPAIFTRRPIPAEAPKKHAIINPPTAIGDEDALISERPFVVIDLAFYGAQPDDLRGIDRAAFAAREVFHSKKHSITPEGYSVIDVRAAGPYAAPTDDAETVGRMVTLTIRLRRQP